MIWKRRTAESNTFIDENGNLRERWDPRGLVAVDRGASYRTVRSFAPEDTAWPPLGQSRSEVTTTQFVLDGTFESDDPEDEAKVRALAQMAFSEQAERLGITPAELEAQIATAGNPDSV